MHISFEATSAARPVKTGVARYSIRLMQELVGLARAEGEDQYEAYYRVSRRWKSDHHPPRIDGLPTRWYQDPIPPLRSRPDMIHGLEMRVPNWKGCRRVATLHDLFTLVSDKLMDPVANNRNRRRYQQMAARCDRIITDSECTRRDFLRFFDFPEERVHTVHLGVDPQFQPMSDEEVRPTLERYALPSRYLLFVGDLCERKNLLRLVRAYGRSKASSDYELVIVGTLYNGTPALEAELARSPKRRHVHILGWLGEEDLVRLYSGAAAFLFPTLYEGFGLPVLEALASGTAVLGANVGAVPEIAGEHAILVDPTDEDAITDGIDAVVDRTPEQIEMGRQHAASFTWKRCARQTRAVYRALCAG